MISSLLMHHLRSKLSDNLDVIMKDHWKRQHEALEQKFKDCYGLPGCEAVACVQIKYTLGVLRPTLKSPGQQNCMFFTLLESSPCLNPPSRSL